MKTPNTARLEFLKNLEGLPDADIVQVLSLEEPNELRILSRMATGQIKQLILNELAQLVY